MVRVAIVGMGIGRDNGRALHANPRGHVVALCDLVPERMDSFSEELGEPLKLYTDYHVMCREAVGDGGAAVKRVVVPLLLLVMVLVSCGETGPRAGKTKGLAGSPVKATLAAGGSADTVVRETVIVEKPVTVIVPVEKVVTVIVPVEKVVVVTRVVVVEKVKVVEKEVVVTVVVVATPQPAP